MYYGLLQLLETKITNSPNESYTLACSSADIKVYRGSPMLYAMPFSTQLNSQVYCTFMQYMKVFGMGGAVRDATSIYLLGVSEAFPAIIFCDLFSLATLVDQMVLGPVSCPAKIHCTAVFALRNGRFSRLGVTHLHTPIHFAPGCFSATER